VYGRDPLDRQTILPERGDSWPNIETAQIIDASRAHDYYMSVETVSGGELHARPRNPITPNEPAVASPQDMARVCASDVDDLDRPRAPGDLHSSSVPGGLGLSVKAPPR